MAKQSQNVVLLVFVTALVTGTCAQNGEQNPPTNATRQGKVFSLFNVVQFKNSGCRSTSTISASGTTSSYRNGTCFTASECQSKGGTSAGNCAAGFGVCCVFLVSASGATISQNCTYIRNPGYPSTYSGTSAVSYTINKACPNVCYLRLDFESFTILGTADTVETNGGACASDTFIATINTKTPVPTICGQNTGQHMYLDIGSANSDSATLAFSFAGTSTSRQWEIKVTQVPCGSKSTPPVGCLQYQTGLVGRLTTYNFIPTNQGHLASQKYSVCIRQEEGYCCIEYSACSDPNSFTIQNKGMGGTAGTSAIDTSCSSLDYVGIAASGTTCSVAASGNVPLVSRFCGARFAALNKATISTPVCSCSQPFKVDIFTDSVAILATTAITTDGNRGVCLNWQQIPCASG